jgi:hypothetical protein
MSTLGVFEIAIISLVVLVVVGSLFAIVTFASRNK